MKGLTYLIICVLALAGINAQTTDVTSMISNFAVEELGKASGRMFVGAMSATQKNMSDTNTTCYEKAELVEEQINLMIASFDPGKILDQGQVMMIRFQATMEACSLEIMINSLDSRMSNLDYTLGIMSNVMSMSFSGLQTENLTEMSNTNINAVYIAFNSIYS